MREGSAFGRMRLQVDRHGNQGPVKTVMKNIGKDRSAI